MIKESVFILIHGGGGYYISCGIYKVENIINHKCYIGQSVQIEKRFKQHKNNYDNKNERIYDSYFYRAIRKYGIDNFKFEILELCDQSELNDREAFWIKKFDSYKNGYNETLGGDGSIRVDRSEFEHYFLSNNPYIKQLAKHFNICERQAGRILKEIGYKSKFYITKEKEQAICDYYLSDDEISLADVEEMFGVERTSASRILKKNNIEVRKITINSLNKYKKILIYDLDGNFLAVSLLKDFKHWLYENGHTKDATCRCMYRCLSGDLWQAYGFIVRWFKDDYLKKIEVYDYWDKNGVYEKKNFCKKG